MPENYTPAAAATGTWTEEEIRHQPRAWIRSLTNIGRATFALNNFLEPLLRKENLRIILTGAGTSAFIGDIIAPWASPAIPVKNFSAVPTTDLVTNSDGLPEPSPSAAVDLLRSIRQQPGKRRCRGTGKSICTRMLSPADHLQRSGRSLPKRDQQR
ncbi:putative tagatose-6-phosphate ketose/aldose isomerase [Escherichia coli]|uniref:Putative tagatose-6-phosphate ketose/aldose isomerase n=1 Tax=Escherichia coli TaxID=562 RepID=A0A376TX46_ECOLX|nr:putative tagatose-6-phosphate ketose/aldose isomerase [Escherichia coli]